MLPLTILPPALIDDITARFSQVVDDTVAASDSWSVSADTWTQRGTERHGSLVWETRLARRGERKRQLAPPLSFLTLAITPRELLDGAASLPACYHVELLLSAVDGADIRSTTLLSHDIANRQAYKRIFHGPALVDAVRAALAQLDALTLDVQRNQPLAAS